MKFVIAALTSVTLVAISVCPLTFAEKSFRVGNGPSAKGKFEITESSEGSPARSIEFNVEVTADGKTVGDVVFQQKKTSSESTSESKSEEKALYLRAECDCLLIKANKAVMSGNIVESSSDAYVGRRFLVVVQDNGATENPFKHDRLTYGVYRVLANNWLVTDSERPDESDPVSTVATDAERPDDPGVPTNRAQDIGCQTFPLSSFSFLDASTS